VVVSKFIGRYWLFFVVPTVLAFALAFIIPFLGGLGLSFFSFTTVENAEFNGVQNYVSAFGDDDTFLPALWFTTKFTIVSVLSVNVLAFALALALTKGLKGTNVFRTVFFMPNLIGGIVLGWVWQLIINGVLESHGVTLTSDPKYGFWGLVILMNWQMIGYMMIIYIAGIQNIPTDVLEAAEIDGASGFRKLWSVTIPLVAPSVTICTFLTLSNSFKLFDQNLALTNGAPANQTRMLALDIFSTFYNTGGSAGVGQAKAVVFFVIVAVIAWLQLRISRSREMAN
jgi:raffinose/stachyose/melibiose transport system permease protein